MRALCVWVCAVCLPAAHCALCFGQEAGEIVQRPGFVISTLAVSPNGQHIAYGGSSEHVHIWNRYSKKVVDLKGLQGYPNALSFSPLGKLIAVAAYNGRNGEIRIWDIDGNGEALSALDDLDNSPWKIDFFKEDRLTTRFAGGEPLRFVSIKMTGDKAHLTISPGPSFSMAAISDLSPDGRNVIDLTDSLWCDKDGVPGTLTIHEVATGKVRKVLQIGYDNYSCVEFIRHDLWAIGTATSVVFIDPMKGKTKSVDVGFIDINHIKFLKDANVLVVVGYSGALLEIDLTSFAVTPIGKHQTRGVSLGWLPEQKRVVTAGEDGTIRFFSLVGKRDSREPRKDYEFPLAWDKGALIYPSPRRPQ